MCETHWATHYPLLFSSRWASLFKTAQEKVEANVPVRRKIERCKTGALAVLEKLFHGHLHKPSLCLAPVAGSQGTNRRTEVKLRMKKDRDVKNLAGNK